MKITDYLLPPYSQYLNLDILALTLNTEGLFKDIKAALLLEHEEVDKLKKTKKIAISVRTINNPSIFTT